MKKLSCHIVLWTVALWLTGCGQNSSDQETAQSTSTNLPPPAPRAVNTNEVIPPMASLSAAQDRGKFIAATEKKLSQVDSEIAALAQKTADLKADAKAQVDKTMEDVHAKRAAVEEKLKDLKQASQAKWEEFKQGVATAIGDLQQKVNQAKESIKKEHA